MNIIRNSNEVPYDYGLCSLMGDKFVNHGPSF